MCKCQSLLYVPNISKGNSVKNIISFTLAPPNIKYIYIYISINLIKYIQNLNEETIKV